MDSDRGSSYPTPNPDLLVIDISPLGPLLGSVDLIDRLVSPEIVAYPIAERASLESGTSVVDSEYDNLVLADEVVMPISSEFLVDGL